MPKQCVILGGGISALSLAWYLQKQPDVSVTLIEKEPRLGGWIETFSSQDYLFERGPRSCRTRGGRTTLELIEELGLIPEVIFASPASKKRYLFYDSALCPLPNSLISLLFSPLTKGLFKALWQDYRTIGGPPDDESIAAFAERRFGRSFAETFMDPLVTGIFAGDMQKLSLRACFPFLAEWEATHGGVVRALLQRKKSVLPPASPFVTAALKQPILSFRHGMETLPLALKEQFRGEVLLGTSVESLETDREGVSIHLSSGKTVVADHVYSTLPAHSLKQLITWNTLETIPFTSVATVHLGYAKHLPLPAGFGYLIPSNQEESILGVVFDSLVFPQQQKRTDETRITVMMGESRIPDFVNWSEEMFLERAKEALARHLKIEEIPDCAQVKISRKAIPHYPVHHLEKIKEMESMLKRQYPQITLLGSSFYGVSINDCIAQAKKISGICL